MSFAPPKQSDATMNDIMASLKRIMNEDERGQNAQPQNAQPQIPQTMAMPMLRRNPIDLTEQVHVFEETDTTRALDPRANYNELDFLPATSPARRGNAPQAYPQDTLLSATTHAAVTQAFSSLSQAVAPSQGKSLDAMVAEMLQPMLKKWLDDNLPPMVERIIRAEIERVARGGK